MVSFCHYSDILKPTAYLIYDSPKLRAAVFSGLGLPIHCFDSLKSEDKGSNRLIKMLEVVAMYAQLRSAGVLPEILPLTSKPAAATILPSALLTFYSRTRA
jgi:hypothetical protein